MVSLSQSSVCVWWWWWKCVFGYKGRGSDSWVTVSQNRHQRQQGRKNRLLARLNLNLSRLRETVRKQAGKGEGGKNYSIVALALP